MQAIARANRVNEGKSNGLVIDYIGIVSALKKALADYTGTRGGGGDDPTVDKAVSYTHLLCIRRRSVLNQASLNTTTNH